MSVSFVRFLFMFGSKFCVFGFEIPAAMTKTTCKNNNYKPKIKNKTKIKIKNNRNNKTNRPKKQTSDTYINKTNNNTYINEIIKNKATNIMHIAL